ncbi:MULTISPECIES: type II secretion system F family protein [unclassified Pseudomonas]|uniref:type II secretion system F family protein n=1 Tax=unclassified Pseudomonas TaxID=196821 RepID=UPI0008E55DAE|nr:MULTISPECIES: type II secretion system F family protein [unclassified Pseudomonas]PMV26700.1 type II secretion system F family protein [Pseudomonas sp. FW305-3-2-15-C-TSA2]PMV32071.1 type II secretion system F family protein [Pseudomonas sp. DP16D-L5]PMV41132.1 type II secretion system F family protein [Pseudomonas sp. FW305-3-2-15-A-LB2]PMV48239.1 type II secretion system F family protein [Pseudomonas sp. FW305-3-2-15-C-R2A1]PMV54696.1 type II secretion system F family protein [Pseudomonas
MDNASTIYAWEGINRKGRRVSGHSTGHNPALVKAQLRRQGISPGLVRKHSPVLAGLKPSIKSADITLLTRQLATLLKAGIPLLQALDIISEGFDNATLRELLQGLQQSIAAGTSLADALRKHPRCFDELYCNLVAAGEQAGALETLLERVAIHREKSEQLKARIKKAMTYPITVLIVASLVTGVLLVHVVPQFQSLFAGVDGKLPGFTLQVIALSEFMQRAWWGVALGLLAAGFGLRHAYHALPAFQLWLDAGLLKAPVAGKLLRKSAVARYARTLSITFAAGVPLVQALDSVAGAAGSGPFRQAIEHMRHDVSTGMQLNQSMAVSGLFPGMAIQMTAIGEESGTLDRMLEKVANHYEADVETLVDHLTSLMEPLIMVVLGGIVGALVIAMYLPVFQLGSAF